MRLRYTALALEDIAHARAHIENESPRAADATITRMQRAIDTLMLFTELGRKGRARTPFVVAYRVVSGTIDILAVIHGARAWPDTL